jgi:hypothetical protein
MACISDHLNTLGNQSLTSVQYVFHQHRLLQTIMHNVSCTSFNSCSLYSWLCHSWLVLQKKEDAVVDPRLLKMLVFFQQKQVAEVQISARWFSVTLAGRTKTFPMQKLERLVHPEKFYPGEDKDLLFQLLNEEWKLGTEKSELNMLVVPGHFIDWVLLHRLLNKSTEFSLRFGPGPYLLNAEYTCVIDGDGKIYSLFSGFDGYVELSERILQQLGLPSQL